MHSCWGDHYVAPWSLGRPKITSSLLKNNSIDSLVFWPAKKASCCFTKPSASSAASLLEMNFASLEPVLASILTNVVNEVMVADNFGRFFAPNNL